MAEADPNHQAFKLVNTDDYFKRETLEAEKRKLWPKVWIIACRVEELQKKGDFYTLDIADESILLSHDGEKAGAFYNVCQHRGRRLMSGSGCSAEGFTCGYHGWRWNPDGSIATVVDAGDWDVPGCKKPNVDLPAVRVDSWGGWYWVTMNADAPPLLEYLAPIPDLLKHHDLEDCRRAWHVSVVFPCNWKLALDAFNEGYHVEQTHRQIMRYGRPRSFSKALGDHGWFGYPAYMQGKQVDEHRAEDFGHVKIEAVDYRKLILERELERDEWLHAVISDYAIAAARRLQDDPVDPHDFPAVNARYRELHREEYGKAGAKWPERITSQDIEDAGTSIHIFPNSIFLPCIDGALWYRARPNGDDPDSCIYDIWWIARFAEGKEPKVEHVFFKDVEAFVAANANPFLAQDFGNLRAQQQGVKSRGFKGALTSPVQEIAVTNFHRALADWLART